MEMVQKRSVPVAVDFLLVVPLKQRPIYIAVCHNVSTLISLQLWS